MIDIERLENNLIILEIHNRTHKPVKHITDGEKYEVELIDEVLADTRDILNKIKNGLFVELPCKVGDKVYCIFRNRETLEWYIEDKTVYEIAIYENGVHIHISPIISYCEFEFGVRIFLTKAEAEQKLKEMRGGNDL